MPQARTSILAVMLTSVALLGCASDEAAPGSSPAALETRAERVGLSANIEEICGLYDEGRGADAREAIGAAVQEGDDRSRGDVERVVYAECANAVTATSLQEIADRQTEEGREQAMLAERLRSVCDAEEAADVVCVDGIAVTFEEGSCDLDDDLFFWLGAAVNLSDEPADATVIVEMIDDDGDRVGEGSAQIRSLAPGGQSTFRTMGNHRATGQGSCELADVRVTAS